MLQEKQFNQQDWFFEGEVPGDHTGLKCGVKIKEKLYEGQSQYQKIEIFDTDSYGKILVLDGIIQTSEKDEFIYHENLTHIPMLYHSNPRNVLVIGGGDGGMIKEVIKHPIEKVWMVDIDDKVIEICKKYIPSISNGAFDHDKAQVLVEDGKAFIKKHTDFFDVIILDISDPKGPAKDLISEAFYQDVKNSLKKDGIVSIQSGSITHQPEITSTIYKRVSNVFQSVKIHRAVIPTYQAGEYSFTMASQNNLDAVTLNQVKERFDKLNLNLKYYNPEVHFSSTILPTYLKELLK